MLGRAFETLGRAFEALKENKKIGRVFKKLVVCVTTRPMLSQSARVIFQGSNSKSLLNRL